MPKKIITNSRPSLLATPSLYIGIDEAGRGCLAGPVVAAAVILPNNHQINGLDDSKKLNADDRESLALDIKTYATFGIGLVWQEGIDEMNILQATFHAMSRAVKGLVWQYVRKNGSLPLSLLHIDGNKTIPSEVLNNYWAKHLPTPKQEALVQGDGLMAHISAASIIAKTHRDHIMDMLDRRWPQYNFIKHKGYGTKEHLDALNTHGPCPLHRKTFARVLPDTKKSKTATQGSLI